MRRKQDDYYEKNYEDENPIIIHANINIGRGQIVIIPIRANDNIAALSANVCKIHGLGTNSVVHLTRVLEEHKGKAMGNKGPTPSVISSISTSTKAVAKFKKLLHH